MKQSFIRNVVSKDLRTQFHTQRQYNLVSNYIKNGFNAYQAAIDAGYSKNFAASGVGALIKREDFQQRIQRAYDRIENKLEKELSITIADKCRVLAQIIYDVVPQNGDPPKRQYYKDALKAMSELSKMQGHYAPDKSLNVTVDATKERLADIKKQYKDY